MSFNNCHIRSVMSFKNRFSVALVILLVSGIAFADDDGCQKKCRQTYPPHTTDVRTPESLFIA